MNEHSFMPKDAAILDAALGLFEERGYGNTPVPHVARRAGVAVGTLYRYFPGKEGLVNALYRRSKQGLAESLMRGLDLDGDPEVVFSELWARLAAFASDHPVAFGFLETHHHAPYLDATSRELTAGIDRAMASLIEGWQRRGVVREGEPALLLALVFGSFVGAFRQLRAADIAITPDLGRQTRDAAWALLQDPSHRKEPS